MIGCELSSDELASSLLKQCLEQGVIVNVTHGNILRIFPALNIDPSLLTNGLETIGRIMMKL